MPYLSFWTHHSQYNQARAVEKARTKLSGKNHDLQLDKSQEIANSHERQTETKYSESRERQKSGEVTIHEKERDHFLILAYLEDERGCLHLPRTLDQYYYHSIATTRRDVDQVIFRYTRSQVASNSNKSSKNASPYDNAPVDPTAKNAALLHGHSKENAGRRPFLYILMKVVFRLILA